MDRPSWLALSALIGAVMAIGLSIAALVLALDDDRPEPDRPLAVVLQRLGGPKPGELLPQLLTPEVRQRIEAGIRGVLSAAQRPALGVVVSDEEGGITVTSVIPGGAAAEAGIEPGAVIQAINGSAVADIAALTAALAEHEVGDTVKIRVEQDGETETVSVTLGKQGLFRAARPPLRLVR